ncbi:hypothetical protein E3P78_01164 [Wallemia ichthyophaga]|nr:hypothetical protein E3P78_01164 [Wallemia ichthyophaga]
MNIGSYSKSVALSTILAGSIKVFNFIINQSSLSYVDPASLGSYSYKLELSYTSIQQLSKDSVGLACLNGHLTSQQSLNIAFISIPLNVITILITRLFFIGYNGVESDFNTALNLYSLSSLLEALIEPLKFHSIRRANLNKKSFIDCLAFAIKSIATLALLTRHSTQHPLTCYAIAQLSYSFIQFAGYITELFSFYPQRLHTEPFLSRSSLLSLRALSTQALIKLALTQGDKFIISSHLSPSDQGAFALADNYGSILARIVFLPIEETSRVYFSNNKAPQSLATVLGVVLHAYSLLLFILPAFLPNYVQSILQILLPRYANSNASSILPHYSLYIPLMAFNGILESFLHSTASSAQIDKHSKFLTLISFLLMPSIYLALSYTPPSTHSLIIVYSNIANLGLRAAYAYRYASRTMRMSNISPSKSVALACVAAGVITRFTLFNCSLVSHMVTGGVCALSVLLIIYTAERQWFVSTLHQMKKDEKLE